LCEGSQRQRGHACEHNGRSGEAHSQETQPNGLRLSRAAAYEYSQTQFYLEKTAAAAPAAC
jgi:hypothetical protein